jgi:hypothetical protein
MNSHDAEQQELQRVIELLGGKTRHGRMLEFIGSRYFQRQHEQLTEIDIAIQVFGRSATSFDPAADAVVRVEAHRLRKKLRDIYEKDRRIEGLQISLPAGAYVPRFMPISPGAVEQTGGEPVGRRRVPPWAWAFSLIALIASVVLGVIMLQRFKTAQVADLPATPAQADASASAAGGAPTEFHIMAGSTGSEVIDNSGVRWIPDRFYARGGNWSRDAGFVRGTSRPFLFENYRTGEFGYAIPATPGSYELRLYFVSPYRAGEEKLADFDVALNGKPLLQAYDIALSANGSDIADEQVFRDVRPDHNGLIHLWFTNRGGSPLLNGLELTPGIPGKLKPIRLTMQPRSYVDHEGQSWRADDFYVNGFSSTQDRRVSGTEDPELFGAERIGRFSYVIPVDRRGRYTVVLYFAEMYHGPRLPGGGGPGSRIFNVFCNGQALLRNLDIYKEAGSLRVIKKTFSQIEPSAHGKINLVFEPVVNYATVSGIEILEE